LKDQGRCFQQTVVQVFEFVQTREQQTFDLFNTLNRISSVEDPRMKIAAGFPQIESREITWPAISFWGIETNGYAPPGQKRIPNTCTAPVG
jgi:hypothetical protein